MKLKILTLAIVAFMLLSVGSAAIVEAKGRPEAPSGQERRPGTPRIEWIRQFGTIWSDWCTGLAVDSSGNTYVTGYTWGASDPEDYDMFVAKYDSAGNQLWLRRFGTSTGAWGFGIAVDSSGNAYVAGMTSNGGQGFHGSFIAKYDSAGNQVWVKWYDWSLCNHGIAVGPSGNLYVVGGGGLDDVYVSKYNSDGNQLWVKNFGITDSTDYGFAIAVDSSGNAYVTGFTYVQESNRLISLALIAKYDSDGNQLWAKWFGTGDLNAGLGITIDSSGNAYVVGNTDGTLPGEEHTNAFIAKFDSVGNQIWIKHFPSTYNCEGITTDSLGGIYGTGQILNQASKKESTCDAIVAKYDSDGNQLWAKWFGTSGDYVSKRIVVDSSGNMYVAGDRYFKGSQDTFVAKLL